MAYLKLYYVLFLVSIYCAVVVECDHEPMNVVVAEPQYQVLDEAKKEELKIQEVKKEEPKKTEDHHHHHDDDKDDPLKGLDLTTGPQFQYLVIKKEEKKNETSIRHHHEHENIYAINTAADEPETHIITVKKEHRRKDKTGLEHHSKKETVFTTINTNTNKDLKKTKEEPSKRIALKDGNSITTSPNRPYFYTPQHYQPSKNQNLYIYNPLQGFQAFPFGGFQQQYQPYRSAYSPYSQFPYSSYPSYRNYLFPYSSYKK